MCYPIGSEAIGTFPFLLCRDLLYRKVCQGYCISCFCLWSWYYNSQHSFGSCAYKYLPQTFTWYRYVVCDTPCISFIWPSCSAASLCKFSFRNSFCDYVEQNPPSIPTMTVVRIACWLRHAAFVIDWHNFGYTLLALTLGSRHPLVTIHSWYASNLCFQLPKIRLHWILYFFGKQRQVFSCYYLLLSFSCVLYMFSCHLQWKLWGMQVWKKIWEDGRWVLVCHQGYAARIRTELGDQVCD